MQKQNMSNSKKRNTSLILDEDKLLAVAVQKYPCLHDRGHKSYRKQSSSKCLGGC